MLILLASNNVDANTLTTLYCMGPWMDHFLLGNWVRQLSRQKKTAAQENLTCLCVFITVVEVFVY